MNANAGKTIFNGHVASTILKALRKLNYCCSQALPNLTQNDVIILCYIFEIVWRKQTIAFLKKHTDPINNEGIQATTKNFIATTSIKQSIRQIANRTGIPKSSVSRSLAALSNEGLLEYEESRIVILRDEHGISFLIKKCPEIVSIFYDCDEELKRLRDKMDNVIF
jgi:DNA-binding transcriptional ArsR family regulator